MRLLGLVAVWLAGVGIGRALGLAAGQWLILAAVASIAAILFRPRFTVLFVLVAALCLGAARYQAAHPGDDPSAVRAYNDRPDMVHLTGIVAAFPEPREYATLLRVQAESIRTPGGGRAVPLHGTVLIRADPLTAWSYGDRVEAFGRIETPPVLEDFSYREYLARQGIFSWMASAQVRRLGVHQGNPILQLIFDTRALALDRIYRLFPDPEASLLAGILLGIEALIPEPVRLAFNTTGTAHIIAISGFNITIIAALFTSLFTRVLGRLRGAALSCVVIGVYTVLVGADAAVVRAALMAGLTFLALRLGRQNEALSALALSAFLMTAANPMVLWDVGFQLSFAATLGLVLYSEPLKQSFQALVTRWLTGDDVERVSGPVSEYALFTLAAQVTTLPLTAYYFQRLTLVGLIANPVILPVQPAVMILGGLAVLVGMIWQPLGQLLAWAAWPFVAFTIRAVEFFSRWSYASIPLGSVSALAVGVFYLGLAGVTLAARRLAARQPAIALPALPVGLALAALALCAGLGWRTAVDQPDGLMRVTILGVGDGDMALIQTPEGRYVLIDGGSSSAGVADSLGRWLPLSPRSLDWVILAGARQDQSPGLAAIAGRVGVSGIWLMGAPDDAAWEALVTDLAGQGTLVTQASPGEAMSLGEQARLEVIAIGDRGGVLLLSYGRARFLFAPGADPRLIDGLIAGRAVGNVTALWLGDSGNVAVNPSSWLALTRPQAALISVQAGNLSGSPSPEVLRALGGTSILRTDELGWISLATNGTNLWVETERRMQAGE
jgi:competence protein ComEC